MRTTKILAGIVTFNPDIGRLLENINGIYQQVNQTVIVDNGSNNIEAIRQICKNFQSILIVSFGENKGIAAALNEIGRQASSKKCDYFLTLDQDSVAQPDLINTYKKYLDLPDWGLLHCYVKDRNKEETTLKKDELELKEIDGTITSGTLMPTALFENGIQFDERLFIDKVDFDLNIQILQKGYKVYRVPVYGLLHEVGEIATYSFFGLKISSYNHSAFRRYYITRNSILLIKKYGFRVAGGFLIGDFSRFVKTILFEKNKISKTESQFKGLIDGIRYKL